MLDFLQTKKNKQIHVQMKANSQKSKARTMLRSKNTPAITSCPAHILCQLLGITLLRKAGEQCASVTSVIWRYSLSHPALPQNNLIIFPSHSPCLFGALHQITLSMSFPRQNGFVCPMLTALAHHIWP